MIVRQFLQWVRSAPAGERAEATSALARAYLYSDLSEDDRGAAEGAMLMLLDDPSPLVRRALAEALAVSDKAPPAVMHSLATDQLDIATIVIGRSPLLLDTDLVELVAAGSPTILEAIAARPTLPRSVCAALAETGSAMACLILLENAGAEIAPESFERIAEPDMIYFCGPSSPSGNATKISTPRITITKRKALGTPFHCVDCHMPNHSPPIVMKPTCQSRNPSVRPSTPNVFARL